MAMISLRKANTRLASEVNFVLYAGNLPFNISSKEMYDIFGKYGAIHQIRIGTNNDTFRVRSCCVKKGKEMEAKDYYQLLGVSVNSTPKQIRKLIEVFKRNIILISQAKWVMNTL